MALDAAQWLALEDAINDAYDINSLRMMLSQRLGRRLDSFIEPTGLSFPDIVSRVLLKASNEPSFPEFIRATYNYIPGNLKFKEFADTYPHLVTLLPVTADPYDACVLLAERVFINRRGLRQMLRKLGAPVGPRVLIVNGERATGKTYTSHLISHLTTNLPGHKPPVYVDLDTYHYTPVDLAEDIGRQMGMDLHDLDTLPRQYDDQMPRWNQKLCTWVIRRVASDPTSIWWFIFDGFRERELREETVDFIERLMGLVDKTVTRLRLILINYTRSLPHQVEGGATQDKIEPIGRTDLESFFEQLAAELAVSPGNTSIKNVIDEILLQVEEKVASTSDGNDKRLQFLNVAVRKAVQERKILQ